MDRTIVVLTADHGEEFLEHASMGHCRTLYDTETRIPLVLWIPGLRGARIEAPVENLDVVPTVLDYLAFEVPRGLDGATLRGLMAGRAQSAPRVTRGFTRSLRSLGDGRYKVILDTETGASRAFDLAADPGEARDLLPSDDVVVPEVAALRDLLVAQLSTDRRHRQLGSKGGKQAEDALRSLGYLE